MHEQRSGSKGSKICRCYLESRSLYFPIFSYALQGWNLEPAPVELTGTIPLPPSTQFVPSTSLFYISRYFVLLPDRYPSKRRYLYIYSIPQTSTFIHSIHHSLSPIVATTTFKPQPHLKYAEVSFCSSASGTLSASARARAHIPLTKPFSSFLLPRIQSLTVCRIPASNQVYIYLIGTVHQVYQRTRLWHFASDVSKNRPRRNRSFVRREHKLLYATEDSKTEEGDL